jgi:sulfonate transport system substrate-binding protein
MSTLFRLTLPLLLFCLAMTGCVKQGEEQQPARSEVQQPQGPTLPGAGTADNGGIALGVQPLATPQSSVSELLARDRILAAQLSKKHLGLRIFPSSNGKELYELMLKGKLQAGLLGDMFALSAAASGDVVIVAMVKQGFSSIVAGKQMLVKDLKGKRVATGSGSTAHFTLLAALENEGLTEQDIRLVDMELNDMPQALAQGRIDAFSAWEPTPVLALAAHPEFQVIHKGLTFAFLCLRRDFLEAHPVEARELAASVARSCLWMRAPGNLDRLAGWTEESASRFGRRTYSLQKDQMIAITRNDLLNIPVSPQIPIRLLRDDAPLRKEFEFLSKSGKIPVRVTWQHLKGCFDPGLLQGVLAEPKRYQLQRFDYH